MKQLYFNRKRVLTKQRGKGAYGYVGFTWRDTVALCIYFVGQVVLAFVFLIMAIILIGISGSGTEQLENLSTNQFLLFGPFLPIFVILVFLFWRELKQDVIDFWAEKWKILGTGFLIWLIGYGLLLLYGSIVEVFLGTGEGTSSNQAILDQSMNQNIVLFILFVVFIVPLIEEIIFRKVLFTHFGNSVNYIVSGIFSVSIFSLIHMTTELSAGNALSLVTIFPSYLMIAVAVTLANYIHKSFIGGYIVHLFHNSIVVMTIIFLNS